MSQENVEIVRKPLRVRERSSRTLDQRLSLRFPRLAAAYLRVIGKLPPGSRFRQAALWRAVGLGLEAYKRRDLDAVVIGCHSEFEYHPGREWVEAGLVESCYRGLEGFRKHIAAVDEVWGGENYVEPVELIDLGERLVVLAHVPMRAQASGVPLREAFALVLTLKDGRVLREEEYYDHDEALEAVGLSEQDALTPASETAGYCNAMSQENVEVVRRFIEALPRAQASDDWRPVLAELHPEVEIDDLDISLDTEHYRGQDSVRKWIGVWMESWESWRLEDVEVRPVGEDRAIGLFLVYARGKGSGIELSRRDALVCTLRAGKIEEMSYYNDQQQALEAVGLPK